MEFRELDEFCLKSQSLPGKGSIDERIAIPSFSTFPRNLALTKHDLSVILPPTSGVHNESEISRATTLDMFINEKSSMEEQFRRRAMTVQPPHMRVQVVEMRSDEDVVTEIVPLVAVNLELCTSQTDSVPSPHRGPRKSLIPPPRQSVSVVDCPEGQKHIMGYDFTFRTARGVDTVDLHRWQVRYRESRAVQEEQWKEFLGIDIEGTVFFALQNQRAGSVELGDIEWEAIVASLTSAETSKSLVGKFVRRWQTGHVSEKSSLLEKISHAEKLQLGKLQSTKGEHLARQGVPMCARALIWAHYLGVPRAVREQSTYYNTCQWQQSQHSTSSHKEIHKDVCRTMRHYPLFQTGAGVDSLASVLCCASFRHAYQGYCQSLNMLAGLLLVFLNEENAFWALDRMMTFLPKDYYSPSMIDVKVDMAVLNGLQAKRLPHLNKHLHRHDVDLLGVCLSWILCCFVDVLPWESTLRVWDVLFFEQHASVLLSVSLAVFSILQPTILSMTCMGDILLVLMNGPASIIDANQLITLAYEKQFYVSPSY